MPSRLAALPRKILAAALYTVLKDQKKTKGKARIETMLREKRPMTVYTIKKEDAPEFARQAKGYGILYAPIPVKKDDNTIDILVFEDDAARANRSWRSSISPWWIRRPSRRTSRNPAKQRGKRTGSTGTGRPGKEPGRQTAGRTDGEAFPKGKGRAGTPCGGENGFFSPAAEKIPSVRAYLREQQQVRKGYF